MTDLTPQDFYVIAREPGAEHPEIPTWACRADNPAALAEAAPSAVTRSDVDGVPGAFQLLGVLGADECRSLVELGETCGYLGDAAVSLGRDIRHNDSFTWIADDETCARIWQRCAGLVDPIAGRPALGINARFRFYRYQVGDYFGPHTDGAWPGSRIVDGELVTNAFPDRYSQLTILLFLSDDYDGGATQFQVSATDPSRPARFGETVTTVDIRTPLGGALCFPHGSHPQHCVHASTPITQGSKYIIRSDVLFEL